MDPSVIAHLTLILVVFTGLLLAAAAMVYMERKVAAAIQQRYGPYLVGPKGLLQPFADVTKLIFKETLRPAGADRWLFMLAPVLSATAAFGRSSSLNISLRTSAKGWSRPFGPTRYGP